MIHDVHADTASIYVATPADLNLRARRSYVYTYLGPPITSVCVVCAGVRGVRGVRRCAWCAPVCAVCVVSLHIPHRQGGSEKQATEPSPFSYRIFACL